MKLILFWILIFTTSLQANSFGQKVTIHASGKSLKSILNEVERQTGYHFVYKDEEINSLTEVDFEVKHLDLNEVLQKLANTNGFSYKLVSNHIILRRSGVGAPVEKILHSQQVLTGRVLNQEGQALVGATITVVGKNTSTATDQSGNFRLSANIGDQLEIIMLGYQKRTTKVQTLDNVRIVLSASVESIADVEVVATGYQTIDKKLFTGSSSSVKMEEIKMDGVTDISRMMEGRIAGVSIQNVSGSFGSAPKLRIRGATSISGDNKPLWVIDGVVLEDVVNVSNDQLSSGDALTLLGSSVAGLNSEDIESLEVLKDASATAMYGARAMNGVVVITTKKGRSGEPRVTYSGNLSTYTKPSYNNFDIMNSRDQMSFYTDLYRKGHLNMTSSMNAPNGGVFRKMYEYMDTYDEKSGQFLLANDPKSRENFLMRYANANTDWFDHLFNNSFVQDHSLAISSGGEKSQHYFSTSIFNDSGWTVADKVTRFTANSRSNYQFTEKFNLGFIVNGSVRKQRAPGTQNRFSDDFRGEYTRDFDINPYSYALNTSRTLTPYDQNGNLEYFTRDYTPFNILHEIENNYIDISVLDFKLQGEANYKFLNNLEYSLLGNVRYVKTNTETIIQENSNAANAFRSNYNMAMLENNKFLYPDPDFPNENSQVVLPAGGFYNVRENNLVNFYGRQTINYKSTIDDTHYINAFGGQEIRIANRDERYNTGAGYQYLKGGTAFTDPRYIKQLVESGEDYFGMQRTWDRFLSFFANVAYSYKAKYVINVSGRFDGTNKFGNDKSASKWLPTYTASAAWNISEEEFMQNLPTISQLKLRAGYGLTASMGSANNFSTIFYAGQTVRPGMSNVENMIYIGNIGNRNLTWEKQHEFNIGLDLGLWKNKLTFNVDYFNRKGFDLISFRPTSGVSGFRWSVDNYADMDSHGIDLTIGAHIVNKEKFGYKVHTTFGWNKNKIVDLSYTPTVFSMVSSEGAPVLNGPVRGIYSIDYQRLDERGLPVFIDENGHEANTVSFQSEKSDHLKYEGSIDPTITGGFNNSFRYGNFTASVFFSYQTGNKVRLDPAFNQYYTDLDASNYDQINAWAMPGDEAFTNIPSVSGYYQSQDIAGSYPYNAYNYSTQRIVNGSFVRLKTVTVNYMMNNDFVKRMGLTGISFGLNANNLFLLYSDKKLKGQDPEFFNSGGVANPLPKQINLSLKLSL
ncbi:SusC/RagA family TonB-linked outer membrane protein [Sphingobacterium sp. UT-1RO-CII-1]|uniref:SusC/RagA family TonB-linked outer membrane protein n=1 Tax=Sphingobacterium sp. UT-1RO-CII-1 TaxID=2995225 RepID=UPI00227C6F68|nr:SusC/RagA family TonB-linked outer membrane protein [Sphingobacterium sp. UT-1RO-CII-1]MCY4780042.1 SusC/RagA family TonB-linked outer membrane protein [Sphingobacterium sp. UT-1RO-CII-1]